MSDLTEAERERTRDALDSVQHDLKPDHVGHPLFDLVILLAEQLTKHVGGRFHDPRHKWNSEAAQAAPAEPLPEPEVVTGSSAIISADPNHPDTPDEAKPEPSTTQGADVQPPAL